MRDDGAAAESDAPRRRIIKRPRLTKLLDEAEARILLLVAPAGYGKTTLAREWITAGGRKAVWLDATPARADVESFALALRDSLRTQWPEIGAGLEPRLRAGLPKPSQLGEFLGRSLSAWDRSNWLVVDDYHLLMENAAVEALFESFLNASKCQVLLSSRLRPSWATTRRLMYGEIEELGRSVLAMTREEANEVLRKTRKRTAGLIALADGWPAIIGLAADTALANLPGESVASSLYDFFAEELFQAADSQVREGLAVLAFAPAITASIASHLLPEGAVRTLAEGVRLGFLEREDSAAYAMHSLIRDFLRRRYSEGPSSPEPILESIVAFFLDQELFDELYVLARDFPGSPSLTIATNRILSQLLEDNRLELVRPWLEHAINIGLDSPLVDLAMAEVAFRDGRYAQSEAAALQSAASLRFESSLGSRALFRAGLAAYHQDRPEAAITHHRLAVARAHTDIDRMQGLWGLLATTLELEDDPTDLLAELDKIPKTPLIRIRVAHSRLSHAFRAEGNIRDALGQAETVLPLLERVDDPMVTSGFLHVYALNLVLAGRYATAANLAEFELQIIRDCGLEFALPHILTLQASALTGLRRFAEAHRKLARAERTARTLDDAFSIANIAVQRARLYLCQGQLNAASVTTRSVRPVTRAIHGELRGAQALAAAADGDLLCAERSIEETEELTKSPEAREFAKWARAVVALQRDEPDAADYAQEKFDESMASGSLHGFVCGYRAFPQLLHVLDSDASCRIQVAAVVTQARDSTFARHAGITIDHARSGALSKRESEVLTLLAEGLSNRRIAERLFISEVTVKVHVRNIFGKLGVHSRTEAALVAAGHIPELR